MSVLSSYDTADASADFAAYAGIVRALGGAGMEDALLRAANSLAPVDEVFAFRRFAADAPQPVLSAGQAPGLQERARLYAAGFYGHDPAAPALIRRRSGFLAQRVRAEDIADPVYREQCYDRPGLAEKVSVAMRDQQEAVVLNFYRSRRRPPLGDRAMGRLIRFGELALPLVRRHAQLAPRGGDNRLARLEARLTEIDASLTGRERAVVSRTLIGRTARSIGEELGIGATSVLTYRRRAYARLQISSSAELVLAIAN